MTDYPPLSPQDVAQIDAGEARALEMLGSEIDIAVQIIDNGATRTQALQAILQGLMIAASVPAGATNLACMHAAAVIEMATAKRRAQGKDDG